MLESIPAILLIVVYIGIYLLGKYFTWKIVHDYSKR